MALTLRLPESLDHELALLANAEHTSKQALIIESVKKLLAERQILDQTMEAVDYSLATYGEALDRLADS